jgi:peptidoglycan hydrolase-like protein with peptidoglycan-binding domain
MSYDRANDIQLTLQLITCDMRGYYPSDNPGSKPFPKRMRYLQSTSIPDFCAMQAASNHQFIYTDCYRTLEQSDAARARKGSMVAKAGDSGHNWGVSFDIWVDHACSTIKKLKLGDGSLKSLQDFLKQFNWTPIVKETAKIGSSESWHFNHVDGFRSSKPYIEHTWGEDFSLTRVEIEESLVELGYLNADMWMVVPAEGYGPTKEISEANYISAVTSFQQAKGLTADGIPGTKTQRTLSIWTRDVNFVE